MRNTTAWLMLLIGGLCLCQGCSPHVRGTGTDAQAQYAWGKLKAELDYPIEATYQAAEKAMEQLELAVLTGEHDEVAGEILARDAHDDTVRVELEALPRSRTKMTVRAGFLGDKNKTNVIFNTIMDNLREDG